MAVSERPSHRRHGERVVWTHPESLLQVALINHADIALTLFYLSWQNPVLPAPQTLMWYRERWSKVLVVVGVVIPLSSAFTLADWMTFLPGVEDLGPSSSGLKSSSLEACLRRFLISTSVPSFLLQVVGN